MTPATIEERRRASKIINFMREQYNPAYVAKLLNISEQYMFYAQSMKRQKSHGVEKSYCCPNHVVFRILKYGCNAQPEIKA